jgi:hypothetical protein
MRQLLLAVALVSCGRPEEIPGPIGGVCQNVSGTPLVAQQRTQNGTAAISWTSGACLELTYAPGMKAQGEALEVALKAWAAAPGTSLCFVPLREDATPLDRTRRRIQVTNLAPGGVQVDLITATFKESTGELLQAEVAIDVTLPVSAGSWLTIAGKLLGFESTSGVDSVLNDKISPTTHTMLTPADLQSVASVYPAC